MLKVLKADVEEKSRENLGYTRMLGYVCEKSIRIFSFAGFHTSVTAAPTVIPATKLPMLSIKKKTSQALALNFIEELVLVGRTPLPRNAHEIWVNNRKEVVAKDVIEVCDG